MIRPQSQHLADRNCGYDTTNTPHRLLVTHAQRMQQAGRSAYTVHLVYSRLGSVVDSRNSKLQPLTAVRPESGLLAYRRPGWKEGNRPMQSNHWACRLHLFLSTRRLGPLSNRAAGRMQVSPRISGEKPGHLRFPSFFFAVGPWQTPRESSHKGRFSMYRYLPTGLPIPHVRLRNSRLDASVVIKLSMALAHIWLGGHC